MKDQDIKVLLEKYSNGQITSEELDQLNKMTHKDKVWEASMLEAASIKKGRRTMVFAMVVIAFLAVGVAMWMKPAQMPAEQLVASHTEIERQSEEMVPTSEKVISGSKVLLSPNTEAAPVQGHRDTAVHHQEEMQEEMVESMYPEMQVLCNLDCDADSVLIDVLRFLNV